MERMEIEGTWEEIARRAAEFAGRRVRVTVLDTLTMPEGKGIPDYLLDDDAVSYCQGEADDSITLEEVRAATASITESMTRVVIDEERAERS